jgi:hypothetical protein
LWPEKLFFGFGFHGSPIFETKEMLRRGFIFEDGAEEFAFEAHRVTSH